jgi:hypothetical protein
MLAGSAAVLVIGIAVVAFVLRPPGPVAPPQAIGRTDTADVHSLRLAGSSEHLPFGHHGGVLETMDGGRTWRSLGPGGDAMKWSSATRT